MYRTIIVAVGLVAVLSSYYFVYSRGYNKGEEVVHALWTEDKLKQTEEALSKQQHLQQEKQKSDERYVNEKRKATIAAASAKSELDRLRDILANNDNRETSGGSCTITGTNGRARLEQELLGQCAATLVAMAAEADRLEAVVVGLQSYVKNVCLSK